MYHILNNSTKFSIIYNNKTIVSFNFYFLFSSESFPLNAKSNTSNDENGPCSSSYHYSFRYFSTIKSTPSLNMIAINCLYFKSKLKSFLLKVRNFITSS